MIELFPTVNYGLTSGQILEFVDIFKTVNVNFSNSDRLQTVTKIIGERPDQLSYRLYNTSNYYWSLFMANGIKNPFKQWGLSEEAFTSKIENEYEGFAYQFANNSRYIAPQGSVGFNSSDLDPYSGVNFSGISLGDLIIVESGEGSYSIKCLGAGVVVALDSCGNPHRGQSIVPDDFDNQKNIKQVSCGNYFSSCLDTSGFIYAWGEDIGLNNFPFGFLTISSKGLYKSISSGYTFINAAGNRIVAITPNGGLTCFGDCSQDFNIQYGGETGFVKTYWTKGVCGGIGIKSNGDVIYYGLTGPAVQFYDADCGHNYGVAILKSNFGLTGFGGSSPYNEYKTNFPTGITGFTAIACGLYHNIAIKANGGLCGFGISAEGRTVVPQDTNVYNKVSAGKYHSAAIDSDDELVVWGKVTTYSGTCVGSETTIDLNTISGTYSLLDSGLDHLIIKNSGTVKKYIGVINSIDTAFKKINAKPYQYSEINPILYSQQTVDPSSSIVSIWRYNNLSNQYEEVQTIQNKFLTIQKYLDSVLYVNLSGNIMNPATGSNFKDQYLINYMNSNNVDGYETLRKQLTNENIYNTSQIKYLSENGVQSLQAIVVNSLNNNINETTTDIV